MYVPAGSACNLPNSATPMSAARIAAQAARVGRVGAHFCFGNRVLNNLVVSLGGTGIDAACSESRATAADFRNAPSADWPIAGDGSLYGGSITNPGDGGAPDGFGTGGSSPVALGNKGVVIPGVPKVSYGGGRVRCTPPVVGILQTVFPIPAAIPRRPVAGPVRVMPPPPVVRAAPPPPLPRAVAPPVFAATGGQGTCEVVDRARNLCKLGDGTASCNMIRECDPMTGMQHGEYALPGGPSGNVDINVINPDGSRKYVGVSGLFDSGFDISEWGFGEWLVAGVAAYFVVGAIRSTKRDVTTVRKSARARSSKARRKAQLKKQLQEL